MYIPFLGWLEHPEKVSLLPVRTATSGHPSKQ